MNILKFLKNIYGKKIYFQTVFITLLSLGTAVAQFWAAQHLGDVIDAVEKGYEETMYQFLAIAVSTMLYILGTALFTFFSGKVKAGLSRCVQIRIGMKVCSAQYHAMEQVDDGELLAMITKDIDSIKNWFGLIMKSGFLPICFCLVPVCLFRWCNWKFALFALCLIPLNAVPNIFFARKLSPFHNNEKKAYARVLSYFTESLRFVMIIKAFQLEQLFRKKHKEELDQYKKIRKKRMFYEKLTEEFGRCYGHISRILLLLLSAYFIDRGQMTVGRLTSVILCTELVGEGLQIVGNIPLYLPAAKAGVYRIQKLFALPEETVLQNRQQLSNHLYERKLPIIEVRKLTFSYGNTTILRDISFCVHQGEKIAVVGHITAATQEAFLFHATLEDNIKIANSDGSKAEIMTACKNAQLDSFIQTLAHGYDTEINTTIQPVSNGQMQRINLARVFYRNTEIFLLDEPASALDSDTANAIWNYLFEDCADKTLLVILHDLEEVCRFQKVLVIDYGKIAAFGTHAELIQNCGLYQNLYERKVANDDKIYS